LAQVAQFLVLHHSGRIQAVVVAVLIGNGAKPSLLAEPFSSTELSVGLRSQFDFVDIPIDTTRPDVAANFKGVSGGGLWRVYISKGTDGKTQTFKILAGLAFWQDQRNSSLLIRCHGPQSIGAVLCRLYD
jgi:hypothetical protein